MKLSVVESTKINASKDKVFEQILNLDRWKNWSPWMCMDPKGQVSHSDKKDGMYSKMSWEGSIVGEGNIQITSHDDSKACYDLTFLKPFSSKAFVTFHLSEKDDVTTVTWSMESSLPIFLFFLKKMFQKALIKDYRRGLKRMKYLIEQGSVPATLMFEDTPTAVKSFNFFGSDHKKVPLKALGKVMASTFAKIATALSKPDNASMEGGISFYEKVYFVRDEFDLSIGIVQQDGRSSVKGFRYRVIPEHKAIKVTLKGGYDFMEDAWSGIMMHARALKFKALKKVAPYEKYIKGPHNTKDPKEYVTDIYFPVK